MTEKANIRIMNGRVLYLMYRIQILAAYLIK